MPNYIEISTTGDISGALKYLVRLDSEPVGFQTPAETNQTLNGDRVLSFGVGKKVWRYIALLPYASAPATYAKLSDALALFSNATAALNNLKFRSTEDATVYDCILLNKAEFSAKPITPRWYDASAQWEVELVIGQV